MKKPVAFTVGVFDCLHEGHTNLLTKMREQADKVVVILHDDLSTFQNKGRIPVQTWAHRRRNLLLTGLADEVLTTKEADPSGDILTFYATKQEAKESVYMRGDDWPDFPGRQTVEELNIPIELVAYTDGVSTTLIREELS